MSDGTVEHVCKSCGNHFKGNYCNLCGEKVLHASDRSFKTFVSQVIKAITFADNKFLKTLVLIIRRPGFISREFADGRTMAYLPPISVFFVLNLVYFLFPVIQLFNASLKTQLQSFYGKLINSVVATKMVNLHINDIESFMILYNQKTIAFAKLLVMVFVVVGSLPLNILYRKRNRYFSDHVAFMVELACFNLFVNAIALSVLTSALGLGRYLDEVSLTIIFVTTNLYFLLRSGAIFYKQHGWKLVIKSMIMLLTLKAALEVYRLILFWITIIAL